MLAHLLHFVGNRTKAQREELPSLSPDGQRVVNPGPTIGSLAPCLMFAQREETALCSRWVTVGRPLFPACGWAACCALVLPFNDFGFAGSPRDSLPKTLSKGRTKPGEKTKFGFPEQQGGGWGLLRNWLSRSLKQFLASDLYPGIQLAQQGSFWSLP